MWRPALHRTALEVCKLLLALNADRVALDLRILDRRIYAGAVSVLFETRLRLGREPLRTRDG